MNIAIRPTPFHLRMAAHNHANAWATRGSCTIPAYFGDPGQEALAARFSSVLFDLSALDEMRVEGPGAASLLAAACGSGVHAMAAGEVRSVHWSAEGGGLRGFGALFREAEDAFVLRSEDADTGWFAPQASRFGATLRDAGTERGLLLLAGPFAQGVLSTADLDQAAQMETGQYIRTDWNGILITLCRHPRLNGYLIACAAGDAIAVFDRLYQAGRWAGLRLAGQEALEILHLEAGLVLPHLDFEPAREAIAKGPFAASLGLTASNGKAPILAGIEFDSDTPRPFVPLFHETNEAGRTLRSAYSLTLRRAIALAEINPKFAAPGTVLRLSPSGKHEGGIIARVTALPFL